jgi:hypothetical protein
MSGAADKADWKKTRRFITGSISLGEYRTG